MKQLSLILLTFFTQQVIAQVFTEAENSPFEQVANSSIAFADVDGDNDLDLLITGQNGASSPITKLYINDGGGDFSEVLNTPFENIYGGSIAFADVDGDNDQDVLITGDKASFSPTTKLYTNDGAGNFTEVLNLPLVKVTNGSVAFADVDGDNDQDVLITGTSSTLARTAKLYLNDGVGNFTLDTNTSFEQVDGSSIAFADVDGDNDQDVFLTGYGVGGTVAYLYTNDGAGNFGIAFVVAGVYNGSVALADVDGDNYQDVLVTGRPNFPMPLAAKLYLNNGSNYLDEIPGTPFEGVEFSAVAVADVDGDNDPDVLITGTTITGRISKLYTNDGAGNFSEVPNTPFAAVLFGSVAFADVDGDNDLDLLLTGNRATGGATTRLYINQGIDTGTEEVLGISSIEFSLYPNPAKEQAVNVIFNAEQSGLIKAKVFDTNGRLVIQEQQVTGIGEQQLILNVTKLPKGSYLLQLNDGVRQGSKAFVVD